MRYLTLVLLLSSLSACSLWPWKAEKTGNCLDDDSCENTNPFEQLMVEGTWYCYGSDRDAPWDCSQEEDPDKVVALTDPEPAFIPEDENLRSDRAELSFAEEDISIGAPQSEPATSSDSGAQADLFSFADSSFAVQLIALQTIDEITDFADEHDMDSPTYIRIRSQGSDWYVLILGVYRDQDEAESAAADWSERHGPTSKPWVRPLGPLKRAALAAEAADS